MKKTLSVTFLVICSMHSFSQNTNPYPTTGNLGLGIPQANFNLQIHGTTDYSVSVPAQPPMYDMFGNIVVPGSPGYNMNFGKTSRLGLTNTTTGTTNSDGFLIRMSGLNGVIENLEKQNVTISSSGAILTFSGSSNRVWFSQVSSTPAASAHAYANIITSNENGLFIKSNTAGKYGISIQPKNATDNAIQVLGTDNTRNFSIQSNGEVYARKYRTTLANIPDYVFASDYNLMPLSELRAFIRKHSHLPNVPSAAEFEQTGVDLGELNRVLLEKVEELTLYILLLEERVNQLEEK